MNTDQVKELFKKIKSIYPLFTMEKEKFDEWYRILKSYSNNGVNRNLDNWLKEKSTEAPSAINLINEFIRIKEPRVFCKYCRKSFELSKYEEYENHVARHNSIIYIKSKEYLVNKKFDEERLMNMSNEEFNRLYEKFQDVIVDLVPNQIERKRLQNCILTRDGGDIELTPELYGGIGE